MMVIENKFNIGDAVYMKADKDQFQFIIIGILVTPIGLKYQLSKGIDSFWTFEIELSIEKDVLKSVTN